VADAELAYQEHRDYVLAVLGRRCRWLEASDREALVHDAYAVMLEKQRDGAMDFAALHPQQVRAYLVQTALYKALDEGKRAGRRRTVALEDGVEVADAGARAPEERADDVILAARVREILAELPERQQTIVKLRFLFEREPGEIQDYLAVTERVYRRELERALRQISAPLDLVREGRFCESRRSLILAYVAGIAGPKRSLDARRHLQTCTACARWAGELRETTERVAGAIVLPPWALAAGNGRPRLIADRAADVIATIREHVVGLGARADPVAVHIGTSLRPAAVAAAVGCAALGGGTVYCLATGVRPPTRASTSPHHAHRHPHVPKPVPAQAAAPSAARLRAQSPGQRASSAKPRKVARHHAAARPRHAGAALASPAAVAREFGIEHLAATPPATKATVRPAPRPPGEFDP